MTEMQKYIQGVAAVPGANVLSHPRCGDADRQRAANRIDEAYARGFLDKDETEARRDAISRCTLFAHLEELTRDIPEMTRWRHVSVPEKQAAEKRREQMYDWIESKMPWLGFSVIAGTLTGAIAPTVTAAAEGWKSVAMILASTTIPVFGIFCLVSLITTMIWLADN